MPSSLESLRCKDHLVRGVALGTKLRIIAVRTTDIARELLQRHETSPTATAALSRVSTACLLMGGTIKGRQQISIQLRGTGPLGQLLAIGNAHGHVRATVDNPGASPPLRDDGAFDVAAAVGIGELIVSKGLGEKAPYHGVVPILSGEIGQDLAHYYTASEQKPTMVALSEVLDGTGVVAAGGYLIQRFPGVEIEEEVLAEIEARIAALPALSMMLTQGSSPMDVLREIFPDMTLLDYYPLQLQCTCERERYARILIGLGAETLEEMLEDDETELKCQFCNEAYIFERPELKALLAAARGRLN